MLFVSGESFYKFVIDRIERLSIQMYCMKFASIIYNKSEFNIYYIPGTNSSTDAFRCWVCISDLINETAEALKELHDTGYAHGDVRLPNICFQCDREDYIVVLIDLDRMCAANKSSGYLSTAANKDWVQLGQLAQCLVSSERDCLIESGKSLLYT